METNCLRIFRDSSKAISVAVVFLGTATVTAVENTQPGKKRPYKFVLGAAGKTYKFACQDQPELASWSEGIKTNIERLSSNPPDSAPLGSPAQVIFPDGMDDPIARKNFEALERQRMSSGSSKAPSGSSSPPPSTGPPAGPSTATPGGPPSPPPIEKVRKARRKLGDLQKAIKTKLPKDLEIAVNMPEGRASAQSRPQSRPLLKDERDHILSPLKRTKPAPFRPQAKKRDLRLPFFEIVSLLPDDSILRVALWENFTTSSALLSKLDEIEGNSEWAREMTTIVLPNVIKAFYDLPAPNGERFQLSLCEALQRFPGFLSRCFTKVSEEKMGGPVNTALCQLADMDRKGLIVDQLLEICSSVMSYSRIALIQTIMFRYLRSGDEFSRIAVLPTISAWIRNLPKLTLPTEKGPLDAFAGELLPFMYAVVIECETQARVPVNDDHRALLLDVFKRLLEVVPVVFPANDNIYAVKWNFLEGKRLPLLISYLNVRNCENFAKIVAQSDHFRDRLRFIGATNNTVPENDTILVLLFEICDISL